MKLGEIEMIFFPELFIFILLVIFFFKNLTETFVAVTLFWKEGRMRLGIICSYILRYLLLFISSFFIWKNEVAGRNS